MSSILVELQKPIWGGGFPQIGVAEYRLQGADEVLVDILYTRKDGTRSYPDRYKMKTSKLTSYPIQVVGGGVRLYVAPLKDWEVIHKEVEPIPEPVIEPDPQLSIELKEEYINNDIRR